MVVSLHIDLTRDRFGRRGCLRRNLKQIASTLVVAGIAWLYAISKDDCSEFIGYPNDYRLRAILSVLDSASSKLPVQKELGLLPTYFEQTADTPPIRHRAMPLSLPRLHLTRR